MTELNWDNGLHSDHEPKWYVNYEITLNEEPLLCQAGPYSIHEVDEQYRDIRGYQGIEHCYTTTTPAPERHNASAPMVTP
jgi:hypothetical protein